MSVTKLGIRKTLALKIFKQYKHNATKLHQLNYIFWECTLRCNLKCIHCGSDCKKDASVNDMPAADFYRALDQLSGTINPNETTIVLTGGEALLRKDLEEIGHNLYNRGFPWGIVTNGMLLTEQKLDALLNAGLRAITISLDGLEEAHNWMRGNTRSYRNAFSAIQLLPQIQDLQYDVVTCVNQKSYPQLGDLKEKLIASGVKEWRIFTIFPTGRAKDNAELQLQPAEFKGLFEFIKHTRTENRIHLNYGCEGFLGKYEHEVRDNFFYCGAGINIASVLADGSISACPSIRSNFTQGNIYQDNFADVWQNKYQTYRDRKWTKTGICADCDMYSYCQGNGIHLRDENKQLQFCHLKRLQEAEQ